MHLATAAGILISGLLLAWLVNRLPGTATTTHRRGSDWDVLVLTAILLLFFWPVFLKGYVFPKGGGDLWGQLYPVWSFVARQLRNGVFPLWDPLLMAGDPIVSEAQYGLLNPLNWFLFSQSPPAVDLVLWRGMVNLLLAGVGMVLFLVRSPVLQLRRPAALVGAIAYMLADPFVVHLGHPQINDAMAWLPWSLLAIDAALSVRQKWRLPLAGLPVALMILAGHGQIALYGLITLLLYGLWRSLLPSDREPADRRPLRARLDGLARLALVAAVGFALAAPMLFPAIERMPWTNRALVPQEQRHGYEFFPALMADSLAPHLHGRGADGWWPSRDRVETAYVGAITLFLAALGMLHYRRRGLFWLGLGGLALLFALGYQTPLYPAVAGWPFFTDLWKTARAIFVTTFALAVLGALGMEALLSSEHRGGRAVWIGGLAAGGLGLIVVAPNLLETVPSGRAFRMALANLRLVAVLALVVAAIAWWAGRRRSRWMPGAIVLLLATELVTTGALAETDASVPLGATNAEHGAALAFLRSDPGWFRVDAQDRARHLWSPESLHVQGFETLQGSGNPLSLWPFEQFYWTQPTKEAPGYRLLGAKYIVVTKGAPPPGQGMWPVFTEDPQIDLYLNTLALPRAWLVYHAEPVNSYEAAWRRVQEPSFDPERVAVVENGPPLSGAGSGRIEVVRYSPNKIHMIVHTDTAALLILSDVYYPGWEATVDGTPVPIYRTDVTFRGVPVPAGSHQVRLRFWPRSFRLGLALGSGALALVLTAAIATCLLGRRSHNRS
jgi:hypothetical protein